MSGPPIHRITLPDTLDLINMNTTKGGRWVKAKKSTAIKEAAIEAALSAEWIPRDMQRVRVICVVTQPRLGDRWDPGNWYASAKPAVDGFTKAGLWPDDSVRHLIGPDMRGRVGVKHPPNGLLEFVIIDLSEGGGHGGPDGWDVIL